MLLAAGGAALHIPTVAEVVDVSGAGDTVLASFTTTSPRGVTAGRRSFESRRGRGGWQGGDGDGVAGRVAGEFGESQI
jgi:hypothetical protein